MRIIVKPFQPPAATTLEQFADNHGLILQLSERGPQTDKSMRWSARFENSEVLKGEHTLCSESGEGPDQRNAIADYIMKISGRILVIDAMTPAKRKIQVPILRPDVLP